MSSKGLITLVIQSDKKRSRRAHRDRVVEIFYNLAAPLAFEPKFARLRTVLGVEFPVYVFAEFAPLTCHLDGELRQLLGLWHGSKSYETWIPIFSPIPSIGRIYIQPVNSKDKIDDLDATIVIDLAPEPGTWRNRGLDCPQIYE